MGRAEDRRARQRGGRRAAPTPSSTASISTASAEEPVTVVGGRAAARRAAQGKGRARGKAKAGKDGRSFIRRLFTWKKIVGTFFGLCLLGMGALRRAVHDDRHPQGQRRRHAAEQRLQVQRRLALARDGDATARSWTWPRCPRTFSSTFVAAENKSFYKDNGVDLKGTARGLINTLSGKGEQGGSTITQQYVKNYYLTQDQTVTRKLKELVISLKVDREKSKDYILAGLHQHQLLRPRRLRHPGRRPGLLRRRRREAERSAGRLPRRAAPGAQPVRLGDRDADRQEAGQGALELRPRQHGRGGLAGLGHARGADVPDAEGPPRRRPDGGPDRLPRGGGQSARSLSQGQPTSARPSVEAGGYTDHAQHRPEEAGAAGEGRQEEARPAGSTAKKRKVDARVQAGAASVDPKTGEVLAMYGGEDYVKHYTNNATRRGLPAGLHLQAADPRRRPGGRRHDAGRQADHGGHDLRRHQQAPGPGQRRSASPRRTRTARTTAPSPSRRR